VGYAYVQSAYYSRDDIPKGDYILYDSVWVRQVIGNDVSGAGSSKSHDEAIFLFGHELGHLLLRHFTSSSELPRIRKEMDADHFGGCAAGALGANWETVADLISRIRGDFDTDYPSRANSLVTAKAGFDTCSRPLAPSPQPPPLPANRTEQAVVKSPLELLVGRWNHDSSGVNIEITPADDIWDAEFGRGRVGLTYDHGANIAVSYPNFSCLYYVTFLKSRSTMVWKLMSGTRNCREGAYTRDE
jgi:hypothetical protein